MRQSRSWLASADSKSARLSADRARPRCALSLGNGGRGLRDGDPKLPFASIKTRKSWEDGSLEEIPTDTSYSTIEGLGLSIGEIRAVARRQLVGSFVVAILVLTIAGFVALRSNHLPRRDYASEHNIRGVLPPTFVTPSEHQIGAADVP
jgi:hypothetical protein